MKKLHSSIFMFIFFLLLEVFFLASSIFLIPLSSYDESWVFANIYKIYNGNPIYITSNIIDTPIFFLIGNLFFHIFGDNILTLKIYNAVIFLLKYILTFALFRKFNVNKSLSALYTTVFIIFDFSNILGEASYNMLAIDFILVGIILGTGTVLNGDGPKIQKKHFIYNLLQGFIIFLVFFTKQTLGIYYAIGIVAYELINYKFSKKFFISQLTKLLTFLPCLLISCLVMFFKGNLSEFINLCFGSILEFGSSNKMFEKSNISFLVFMLFTLCISIYILVKVKNLPEYARKNIKFLLCISVSLSLNMYPLINRYHVTMCLLFYYILFIYIIHSLLLCDFIKSKHTNLIILTLFLILYFYYVHAGYTFLKQDKNKIFTFEKDSPFYGTYIDKVSYLQMNTISNYISFKKQQGTKVLVLSNEAAVYMVPLNINNGEFDMLLSGNLGYNGVQNTIDKISKMHNTEFLIFTDEEDCFYQEPKEIREYIMNNYQEIGKLYNYSIYTTD